MRHDRSGPPQAQTGGGLAYIRAVQACADALRHVHFLGRAGVRAAEAHFPAVHQVVDGIAERLVHMTLHVGMQADHLADGHSGLP